MKLSLRVKFLLISGAGQAVVVGLLLANSLRLMDDAVSKNAYRVAHEYAVTLNLSLTPYASTGRLPELTTYLKEMLKDPRDSFARYVVVLGPNGRALLSVGQQPASLDALFAGADVSEMGGVQSTLDHDVLHARAPLLLEDNQVGTMYFGVSTADLSAAQALVLQQGGLIALASLGLGLLICYAFSASLGRRLTALTRQSVRLAHGDFEARLPERGDDEIDFFSRSLNTMSSALRQRIADLDQAERRLGESEVRFRVLFDTAPVSLIVTDGDGVTLASNLTLSRVLGKSATELIGKRSSEIEFWANPDERARIWDIFARDGVVQGETAKVKLLSGRQGEVAIWSSSVTLDDSPAVIWALLDLTEELDAKRALHELNVTLESRVQERSAELVAANVELSQALVTLKRAQQDLISAEKMASLGSLVAGVAHELNTPIGNSLLAATTLADRLVELEGQVVDGSLRRSLLEAHVKEIHMASTLITRSLERAAGLITAFKQVAVDQTNDQRRRFDLLAVIEDTLATFAPRLRRANCKASLVVPEGLVMDSYPGSLYQVFSNLINNALAHAFTGCTQGAIAISAHMDTNGQIEIKFSDDGAGMSEAVLRRVFDPFFTTKMGQGGTGLGMNIVYNIVTGVLGGTIAIEASEGQGTTVKMEVPPQAPVREAARTLELTT
ncbi:PAS domain S-box protein [Duganella sp. FT135W]|uniref:histidine kinase n=1 Tax=Duganella flavida TaxID=2692175 RepID=A0A6L8KFS7_9BURK|nr:ATP-binding protein [Duganella flavida]MYM26256.1 PAS domain S-box protein [Duganella flavida]